MRCCRCWRLRGDAAEIANTANTAVLAGIVAAIAYAMMQVDGAELFPAAARGRAGDQC